MKNKIVYLVKSNFGGYEDYGTYVEGIFEDKEVANNFANEITVKMNEEKNLPDPFPNIDEEKLTEDENNIYQKWLLRPTDFNSVEVIEFELNKKL